MPLDLDPHPRDGAPPTGARAELDRVLHALAAGDAAFVLTLVERFGVAIADELRAAGAPLVDLDARVHDVAFALLGAPVDPAADPWTAVRRVVAQIAGVDLGAPGTHLRCDGRVLSPLPAATARPRTVHLVDIENLAGGPRRADQWFDRSLADFRRIAEVDGADHLVMAADVNLWRRTAFDVAEGRYLFGYGPDGADRVLLREAPVEWVASRFGRLVVGSGDHAFAPLVRQARRRGLEVLVVARAGSLAATLRWEATRVELLPALPAA